MPRILPSQVVVVIDTLFGSGRNELDNRAVTHNVRAEVHALLAILDDVPRELVDLELRDYLELNRCKAVLATALATWSLDGIMPARDVGGKDPIERIRRLMQLCADEVPPLQPELPFVTEIDIRLGIEDRIQTAWVAFNSREWFGATVFAAAALEALLLWALKTATSATASARPLDNLSLADLIERAGSSRLIEPTTAQQASLARNARNLIHPGKALRSGQSCNKATALTALAAVYRTANDLEKLNWP